NGEDGHRLLTETPMKCWFGKKFASGHCLDSVSHWHFVNCDRHLADESPME
ncbi:hypothetical protein HAX54_021811, partial [Datura stramonium]|nr:hypothetical protein [Datura stramonium]